MTVLLEVLMVLAVIFLFILILRSKPKDEQPKKGE